MNFLSSLEHFYVTFIHFTDRSTLWTWKDKFLFLRDGERNAFEWTKPTDNFFFFQLNHGDRYENKHTGWKLNFLFLTIPQHIDLETIEIHWFRLEISHKRDNKIYTQFNSLIRPDLPTIRTMNN